MQPTGPKRLQCKYQGIRSVIRLFRPHQRSLCRDPFPRHHPRERDNPAHANILLGIVRPNEAIPSEIMYILDNLLDRVVFIRDPEPDSLDWKGDPLEL